MALPALATTWEIDGLSLNTGPDDDGFSYIVKSTKGWRDSAPGRPQLINRPTANGAYRSPNYVSPRVVELDGIAQAPTKDQREALADALSALCLGPDDQFQLTCHERTRSLYALVERSGTISVTDLPDGFTVAFNIQLIAADPRKYSTELKGGSTTLAQAGVEGVRWSGAAGTTGVEWDGPAVPQTGTVWQYSSGSSGYIALENDGRAPTPILFTITAPSTGSLITPMITVVDTGDVLSYGGTMVPGDVMTIDTGTGLALLNGNDVGALFTRYNLFEVPGRTTYTIQFDAGGPADTAALLAQLHDAY